MRKLACALLSLAVLSACASRGDQGEPLPDPPAPKSLSGLAVEQLWRVRAGGSPADPGYRLEPAVSQGHVYVADADGVVRALSAADGGLAWKVDLQAALSGGPDVAGGVLVVGGREGKVIALSAEDGSELWRARVTSEVTAVPRLADGRVLVRTVDGRVFGLDRDQGRRLWLFERSVPTLTLRGTSSPVAMAGLALVGLDNGTLVALNHRDGSLAWEIEVAAPRGRSELERMVDIDGDPAIYGREVYAVSYQGRMIAADVAGGNVNWSRDFSSHVGLGVDSERVYATDSEQFVWALDRFSGTNIWRQDLLRGLRLTGPVAYGDYVLVGDSDGYLNWLAAIDGELLERTRIGRDAIVRPPVVVDGIVYVVSTDGVLKALQLP